VIKARAVPFDGIQFGSAFFLLLGVEYIKKKDFGKHFCHFLEIMVSGSVDGWHPLFTAFFVLGIM
jgi:hypothetical protein